MDWPASAAVFVWRPMLERVWRARDRVWRLGEGDVGGDGVRAALEWPALLRKLERVDPVCRQAEAALSDQPGARGRVTTRPTPQWTLRRTATRRRIICWKSPICFPFESQIRLLHSHGDAVAPCSGPPTRVAAAPARRSLPNRG